MEEMIRFVKRTYDVKMFSIEYQDLHYFKTNQALQKALNLVDMTIFEPSAADLKFADAPVHSFLERMTTSWRSFFSNSSKVAWVKLYYVLRKYTIYIFEKDFYDTPADSIYLGELKLVSRSVESRKAKFDGRAWVLELTRNDQAPLCLSCEDEETYKKWHDTLESAIEECRMNA
jgi:hypothetical protein